MMFTEEQIKAAHSTVKTGADFPAYIKEIKALGLLCYEFWVTDGHTVYYGDNDYQINTAPIFPVQRIADRPSAEGLKHNIQIHQQGHTNFGTFCRQAAQAGVEKWVVDTEKMLCAYYDKTGNEMLAEPIPDGEY